MKVQNGGKCFVKKTLFVLIFLTQQVFAYPPLPEARSESEALFVRRILDFWRDKEYPFAKSQIRAYMHDYPHGPFTDHFYAMLGDMAMHERAYREALEFYNRISHSALTAHVSTKKWQALYHLQLYAQLYQEIGPTIAGKPIEEEGKFYFAEAAFREALTLWRYEEGKEEAKALYEEALAVYASLTSSAVFGPHAKLAMAEIYRILNNPEKAAALYLELAETEEHPEEILFHAGVMLTQFDQEKAKELFAQIAQGTTQSAPEAAYQWLQMLANAGEWETIAHERDLWLEKVPQEHMATAYFYLGMVAFDQKNYYQAIADLQKTLEEGIASPHDRSALEALITSAKEVQRLDLCEENYLRLTKAYPEQKAEAGYVRALAYQQAGESATALILFEELTQHFPGYGISEKASLAKIKLLMMEKRWEEAHEGVDQFLKTYPLSERKAEMLRLAIDLSRIQSAEGKLYHQLAQDLERAFAERIFQGEERKEKEELLAKAYIKLGRIHAALGLLHEMPDPDPLLFTQCYIKEGNAHEKVIYFGEKALEKYPDHDRLHLHLFNAYLQLAKNDPDDFLTNRAAYHLNTIIDVYPVSLENRLWLAHYCVKTQNDRALYLLESLLQTDANWKRFDQEGLMLARLYQNKGQTRKAQALVEKIIALGQNTQPEAELILAEILEGIGEIEQAQELYARLEEEPNLSIAYEATLQSARLCFAQQPENSLKKLHHLKMCKNLATEPIHLEAALDYAELQASLCPQEQRLATYLAALLEVKEEFTSDQDICSKDYQESRQLMPEKEQIYQAYMRYVDARIYNLQAKMSTDSREKKVKENAARALFSTLRQGKYALTNYLIEHATAGMYEP